MDPDTRCFPCQGQHLDTEGESAGPSKDAGSGMPPPTTGVLWMHQLHQRCHLQLVAVMEEKVDDTQA
ncbi:hypothetical protein Y1Q_0018325 [Alligator mississippiensis]|uniref:Uncharacterized protein n=1 Tax=Alligator mississippiensis TaxID=8496 RepID=A0A151PC26_ALLMI|nr:hypothetical protein Y1Q_0018325 [Alligator mississippiensis]